MIRKDRCMAAMTTTLIVKSISGSVINYTTPEHTASKSSLLIQASQPAVGGKLTSSDTLRLSYDAVDSNGVVLGAKDSIEIVIKRAVGSSGANWTGTNNLKTRLIDIINGDEFVNNVVDKSLPIKAL